MFTRVKGRAVSGAACLLLLFVCASARASYIETGSRGHLGSYAENRTGGIDPFAAVRAGVELAASLELHTGIGAPSLRSASGVGVHWDPDVGLSYAQQRWYDPAVGRFLSEDPVFGQLDNPVSLHRFAYANGNPVRWTDPQGRESPFDTQQMMMGMMWSRLGREIAGAIEGLLGGAAHVSPASNVVEYSGPRGGVGGLPGGVVRTLSVRYVPIEENASECSLAGMEAGARLVPIADPAERLAFGTTVTEQPTSRLSAAVELSVDLVPIAASYVIKARVRGQLLEMLRLRRRQLELGTDPARGYIASEGTGGVHIEQALGREISRSSDPAADFVDVSLGPIQLKGPIPSQGSPMGLANSAVKDAMQSTSTKVLFVDLTGLPAEQAAVVKGIIRSKLPKTKKRIVFLE